MKNFRVVWNIDCSAKTAEEAANYALTVQRDKTSLATVFTVEEYDQHNREVLSTQEIDLLQQEDTSDIEEVNQSGFLTQGAIIVQELIDAAFKVINETDNSEHKKILHEALKPFKTSVTLPSWNIDDVLSSINGEMDGNDIDFPGRINEEDAKLILRELTSYEVNVFDWIAIKNAYTRLVEEGVINTKAVS
jgi:hypothetical protein